MLVNQKRRECMSRRTHLIKIQQVIIRCLWVMIYIFKISWILQETKGLFKQPLDRLIVNRKKWGEICSLLTILTIITTINHKIQMLWTKIITKLIKWGQWTNLSQLLAIEEGVFRKVTIFIIKFRSF